MIVDRPPPSSRFARGPRPWAAQRVQAFQCWGLACAIALLGPGCAAGDTPERAVRALGDRAAAGARDQVYALLGPATRARLQADARRAAELSGRRAMTPEEMLAVGWTPRRFIPISVRELEHAGDRAVVEVAGPAGERERITCVRIEGHWRVELPEAGAK